MQNEEQKHRIDFKSILEAYENENEISELDLDSIISESFRDQWNFSLIFIDSIDKIYSFSDKICLKTRI